MKIFQQYSMEVATFFKEVGGGGDSGLQEERGQLIVHMHRLLQSIFMCL